MKLNCCLLLKYILFIINLLKANSTIFIDEDSYYFFNPKFTNNSNFNPEETYSEVYSYKTKSRGMLILYVFNETQSQQIQSYPNILDQDIMIYIYINSDMENINTPSLIDFHLNTITPSIAFNVKMNITFYIELVPIVDLKIINYPFLLKKNHQHMTILQTNKIVDYGDLFMSMDYSFYYEYINFTESISILYEQFYSFKNTITNSEFSYDFIPLKMNKSQLYTIFIYHLEDYNLTIYPVNSFPNTTETQIQMNLSLNLTDYIFDYRIDNSYLMFSYNPLVTHFIFNEVTSHLAVFPTISSEVVFNYNCTYVYYYWGISIFKINNKCLFHIHWEDFITDVRIFSQKIVSVVRNTKYSYPFTNSKINYKDKDKDRVVFTVNPNRITILDMDEKFKSELQAKASKYDNIHPQILISFYLFTEDSNVFCYNYPYDNMNSSNNLTFVGKSNTFSSYVLNIIDDDVYIWCSKGFGKIYFYLFFDQINKYGVIENNYQFFELKDTSIYFYFNLYQNFYEYTFTLHVENLNSYNDFFIFANFKSETCSNNDNFFEFPSKKMYCLGQKCNKQCEISLNIPQENLENIYFSIYGKGQFYSFIEVEGGNWYEKIIIKGNDVMYNNEYNSNLITDMDLANSVYIISKKTIPIIFFTCIIIIVINILFGILNLVALKCFKENVYNFFTNFFNFTLTFGNYITDIFYMIVTNFKERKDLALVWVFLTYSFLLYLIFSIIIYILNKNAKYKVLKIAVKPFLLYFSIMKFDCLNIFFIKDTKYESKRKLFYIIMDFSHIIIQVAPLMIIQIAINSKIGWTPVALISLLFSICTLVKVFISALIYRFKPIEYVTIENKKDIEN